MGIVRALVTAARPLDATELLVGADHHHRNVGAARLMVQPADKTRGLAMLAHGGKHDEIGTLPAAKRQRHLGVDKGFRADPAERSGQSFEDFQMGRAVIDDDDQLGGHGRTPT